MPGNNLYSYQVQRFTGSQANELHLLGIRVRSPQISQTYSVSGTVNTGMWLGGKEGRQFHVSLPCPLT